MAVSTRSDLFGVDPNEFVAARDQLARALKAGGEKDEAAAVRALRRPRVPVWALNQVARKESELVATLLERAADARLAQREAIERGKPERLRDALAQRRAALSAVAKAARAVVEDSGRSGDANDRDIEGALTALVTSDRMDAVFRAGVLTSVPAEEDDAAELLDALAESMPARPQPRPPSKQLAQARADLETRRTEAAAADRIVEDAEADLVKAEAHLRASRKTQAAAHRAVETAEARVAKLDA